MVIVRMFSVPLESYDRGSSTLPKLTSFRPPLTRNEQNALRRFCPSNHHGGAARSAPSEKNDSNNVKKKKTNGVCGRQRSVTFEKHYFKKWTIHKTQLKWSKPLIFCKGTEYFWYVMPSGNSIFTKQQLRNTHKCCTHSAACCLNIGCAPEVRMSPLCSSKEVRTSEGCATCGNDWGSYQCQK